MESRFWVSSPRSPQALASLATSSQFPAVGDGFLLPQQKPLSPAKAKKLRSKSNSFPRLGVRKPNEASIAHFFNVTPPLPFCSLRLPLKSLSGTQVHDPFQPQAQGQPGGETAEEVLLTNFVNIRQGACFFREQVAEHHTPLVFTGFDQMEVGAVYICIDKNREYLRVSRIDSSVALVNGVRYPFQPTPAHYSRPHPLLQQLLSVAESEGDAPPMTTPSQSGLSTPNSLDECDFYPGKTTPADMEVDSRDPLRGGGFLETVDRNLAGDGFWGDWENAGDEDDEDCDEDNNEGHEGDDEESEVEGGGGRNRQPPREILRGKRRDSHFAGWADPLGAFALFPGSTAGPPHHLSFGDPSTLPVRPRSLSLSASSSEDVIVSESFLRDLAKKTSLT